MKYPSAAAVAVLSAAWYSLIRLSAEGLVDLSFELSTTRAMTLFITDWINDTTLSFQDILLVAFKLEYVEDSSHFDATGDKTA